MSRNLAHFLLMAAVAAGVCVASPALFAADCAELGPSALPSATVSGGRGQVQSRGQDSVLRIKPDGGADVTRAVLVAPQGAWDLSAAEGIAMTVRNLGRDSVMVRVLAENPDAKGMMDSVRTAVEVQPGQEREVVLRLARRPEDPGYDVFEPFYMYFKNINIRDNTLDPSKVARLVVSVEDPEPRQAIEISNLRPVGDGEPAPADFFPFVDAYGQYIHTNWPGKIHSDEDFAARREAEAEENARSNGPDSWNKYGGWEDGPQLEATGHFRVTRHDGKWWLVDPSGRLFWSHGPTGVGFGGDVTPITDREHWFERLPARDSELGRFYRNGRGATYRYYQDKPWTGFDIQQANLLRKYGESYEQEVAQVSHDRLRSWGFNTLGNWSAPEVYRLSRTPYTVAIHYASPLIHYRMPDIYDPAWEPALRARMEQERGKTSDDPYNIGYFVDNERWFGWRPRAAAIGEETLKNPPERHAKQKFVAMLREKYDSIGKLNEAWGTQHHSWDALLAHREAPNMDDPEVLADCGDFGMMFAERYFSTCRDVVKSVAPDVMYLGSRFHGHIDKAVLKLASQYADVVSYNIYDNPPAGRVNQYNELDVPIMSTEWGIGSDPSQTPFRGSSLNVPTPAERAREMTRYLEQAIRHPNLVGAHFFQFRDQPLSGRPDGEATLRGFVSVADTPNFELVQANRRFASNMYETRAQAGK